MALRPPPADRSETATMRPMLLSPTFQQRLERLHLATRRRQLGEARGHRAGQRLGVGIEFAEHRDYRPGDDLRFVDFHAYARTDRLLVKQYSELQDLHVHILLDCSASMATAQQRKLNYAKQLAAGLAYVALSHLDLLFLQTFSTELGPRLPPLRGRDRVLRALRFLEPLTAHGKTDVRTAVQQLIHREPHRGLVLIITDGTDARGTLPAIDLLRYARFEPALLVVRDDQELAKLPDGAYELVDSETGVTRIIEMNSQQRSSHQQQIADHFRHLAQQMRERESSMFELRTEQPFDAALVDVLNRGKLLL